MKYLISSLVILPAVFFAFPAFASTIATNHPSYGTPASVSVTCSGNCGIDVFNNAGTQLFYGDNGPINITQPWDLYTYTSGAFTSSTVDTYWLIWPQVAGCNGVSLSACQAANAGNLVQTSFTVTSGGGGGSSTTLSTIETPDIVFTSLAYDVVYTLIALIIVGVFVALFK